MAWNSVAIFALVWFALIAMLTVWSAIKFRTKKIYLALFAATMFTNACICVLVVLHEVNAYLFPIEIRLDAIVFHILALSSQGATLILYLNILLHRYMRIFMIVKKTTAYSILTGLRIVISSFIAVYVALSILYRYQRYSLLQEISRRAESLPKEEQQEYGLLPVIEAAMAVIACILVVVIEIGITLRIIPLVKRNRVQQRVPAAAALPTQIPFASDSATSDTHSFLNPLVTIPAWMKLYLYMGLVACSDILVAAAFILSYSENAMLYSLTLIAGCGVSIHIILYFKFLDILILRTKKQSVNKKKPAINLNIVKPNSTVGSIPASTNLPSSSIGFSDQGYSSQAVKETQGIQV